MKPQHIHTAAAITSSIYRIAYTSMLLFYLFRKRDRLPAPGQR